MSRLVGSWLSGPVAAGSERTASVQPGERLGLPVSGPGSLATAGRRVMGFLIDVVLSALVAGLFTAPELPRNYSLLVFVVEYVAFSAFFGQTPGMRLVRIHLARVDGARLVGLPRATIRTALLVVLIPAAIWNSERRGLHDRAAGTVVVQTR